MRRGPRTCIDPDHRRLFGKSSKVIWLTEKTPPAVLAAAYLQHVVSLAAYRAMRQAGQTIGDLATVPGFDSPDTLRRKLRGEVWMSTTDITALELAFPSVHNERQRAPLLPAHGPRP